MTYYKDAGFRACVGVAIAPDKSYALVGNFSGHGGGAGLPGRRGSIGKIDLHTCAVSFITDPGINGCEGVAIAHDGSFALLANNMGGNIGRVDLRTNVVSYPYNGVRDVYGLDIAPASSSLYW